MRFEYVDKELFYELDNWNIIEEKFNPENSQNAEAVFTTANGYIGMRGQFEEGYDGANQIATVLNGVYEYFELVPVPYRPGFVHKMHSIIRQINPLNIKVFINGELAKMTDNCYERKLSFKDGLVSRTYEYETREGKKAILTFKRFAVQNERNLLCFKLEIEAKDELDIKVVTLLNKKLGYEQFDDEFDQKYSGISYDIEDNLLIADYETKISKFAIRCAIKETNNLLKHTQKVLKDGITTEFSGTLKKDEKFEYERLIGYSCSKDIEKHKDFIIKLLKNSKTFKEYLEQNKKTLDDFWNITDVTVDNDTLINQGVRFSMFQVYQSAGRDGLTNISANGLTGTVYQGHTFWDTEMYMLPMFTYGKQDIAKKLLEYRYSILDKARERAKQMDDQGALYAWCSINGEENSVYHEASTAQYHLNADIGYAIQSYYEASNDIDFMENMGLEMLFEISKCLVHRGCFVPLKGNKFCINVICGPDEYNPIVDNNLYTNLLTKRVFDFTLKMKDVIGSKNPQKLADLVTKCGLNDEEFALIKRAADNTYIPYNKKCKIYMQDDNFMYKDPINIDDIPKNKIPLLGNLHPLNLWRFQLCKQADIVLATFICSDFFKKKEIEKIFDYYEPKTMHDSSLSAAIHSIVACSIGRTKDAYNYLKQSCRMDLDNVNGNTAYGLHAACMGGSRMLIVNGYGGLRVYDNKLHFEPTIHNKWNSYSFKISFKGALLNVHVDKNGTTYNLEQGDELIISHFGKNIKVTKEKILMKNGK